jgi:hypothetical protein
MLRHGYLKYVGDSTYDGKALYNFINGNQSEQRNPEIDYTLESERKEKLTELIEAELKSNTKLSESDAVQKFSTKDISEDLVVFCFDIAKNHILLKSQKNEKETEKPKK